VKVSESGEWVDCYNCHGIGSDNIMKCTACGGLGRFWVEDDEDETRDED
jgi:hypothetical protein